MHLVSRALARVTVMLFGPPEPSRAACATASAAPAPSPAAPHPSPEMWEAILAGARRRRVPRQGLPSAPPPISAEDITSTLVGIYLLPPAVRQQAGSATRLAEEACR